MAIARRFKMVLNRFLSASGGLANEAKSQVFTWNASALKQRKTGDVLGYKVNGDWQEFKYLGVPIYLRKISPKSWQQILDRTKIKMKKWGARWLNVAGRSILVKVVLSAIPIYQFSALLAPKYALHQIGVFLGKFL